MARAIEMRMTRLVKRADRPSKQNYTRLCLLPQISTDDDLVLAMSHHEQYGRIGEAVKSARDIRLVYRLSIYHLFTASRSTT